MKRKSNLYENMLEMENIQQAYSEVICLLEFVIKI